MKRDHLTFLGSQLLAGFLFLATSLQSLAADDVRFACSHHGPKKMMLTLSLEEGAARQIEIEGVNNGDDWDVKIDGKKVAAGQGGQTGDTIKVHSGDTIIWTISAANHGVAFAEQKFAETMFKELKAGGELKLENLNTTLTSQDWMDFGKTLWGTKRIDAVQGQTNVMVMGTVK